MNEENMTRPFAEKLRLYLFPVLITILGWFINQSIYDIKNEIREIKKVMIQVNMLDVRVQSLERQTEQIWKDLKEKR
jgi:hypothetical protein